MDRTMVRNASLSVVLAAGLGLSGLAVASNANAAESASKDKAAASATEKAASASSSAKAEAGALKDGTYEGSAKGMESTVKVTVTVKDGKISDVKAEGQETQGIGSKAIEQLPAKIVEANGTEGVDAVSGATVTSKAIFSATDQALESAKGGSAAAASSSKDKAAKSGAAESAKASSSAKESK